jgi:hypothetical protein
MDARGIAKQMAYGRIAFGAAMLVQPEPLARVWLGSVAQSRGVQVLTATFGARDSALGAGAAYALHAGRDVRPWLLAGAFADTVDAVTTFAARRSLPAAGAAGTVALATAAAALGFWAARSVD